MKHSRITRSRSQHHKLYPKEGQSKRDLPSNFPSTLAFSIIGLLAISMMVTMLTSSVLSPLHGPDERHHYSYVKHVAENPIPFPPKFEKIRTPTSSFPPRSASRFDTTGDQNHLHHPPLYYYVMSVPYKILSPDDHIPSIADDLEKYGGVSMRWGVPALRIVSLTFPLIASVGIFFLLRYMVTTSLLSKWAALVFALCISFVPAYTFIGATLNNDALSLAIWPFLLLTTLKFIREHQRRDGYILIFLCGVAALTKLTLYPLAASAALAALIGGFKRSNITKDDKFYRIIRCARNLLPRSRKEVVPFIGASASVVLTLLYSSTTLLRYGSLVPSGQDVYSDNASILNGNLAGAVNFLASQSIVTELSNFGLDDVSRESPLGFVFWWLSITLRSLFGILSQSDKLFPSNPARITVVLVALTLFAVLLLIWRMVVSRPWVTRFHIYVSSWLVATAVLFVLLAAYTQYEPYHSTGHASAQGRYLIGYADWWLLGILVAISRVWVGPFPTKWGRAAKSPLTLFVVVALLGIFVQPVLFLRESTDVYRGLGVASLVREEAVYGGLKPLDLSPVQPDRFIENGVRPDAKAPEGSFVMAWDNSEVETTLDTEEGKCIEVWVHASSEGAWGERGKLKVVANPRGEDGNTSSSVLAFGTQPEVGVARFDYSETKGEVLLSLQFINNDAMVPGLVHGLWPKSRVVEVVEVYGGGVQC